MPVPRNFNLFLNLCLGVPLSGWPRNLVIFLVFLSTPVHTPYPSTVHPSFLSLLHPSHFNPHCSILHFIPLTPVHTPYSCTLQPSLVYTSQSCTLQPSHSPRFLILAHYVHPSHFSPYSSLVHSILLTSVHIHPITSTTLTFSLSH